jgi:hypothetical protein
MKSEIFSSAINNRNEVKFLYFMDEVVLHPYYISREKNGKKVIYGRMSNSSSIKKFELGKIANLKVSEKVRFSPIIPLMSKAS